MAEVFCIECRFLRPLGGGVYRCNKARVAYEESWLQRKPVKETPAEKNAGNACPDYKAKNEEEEEEG